MTDAIDPARMIEAAQQAAADGDFSEAERLLRGAAAQQQRSLGALHPDLASTLNNLALVCERTNKLDEAERGYRRAHAIAVASLSPGHPFVTTSLKNLVDFCAAHDVPIWRPPAVTSDDEHSSPEFEAEALPGPALPDRAMPDRAGPEPTLPEAVLPEPMPALPETMPPLGTGVGAWPLRTIAVATLGVAVVVAVAFAVQRGETTDTSAPVVQAQNSATVTDSPPPSTPPAPISKPQPTVTLERRPEPTPAPVEPPKPPKPPETPETPVTPSSVRVLNAQLCTALEKQGSPDWQCAPVTGDPRPGTYFFYMRLLTNAETTVEHRWYRGERVQQVRRLRVTASPGRGYRMFSSSTVSPGQAGDWKVELRGADGTVLWEKPFVVR